METVNKKIITVCLLVINLGVVLFIFRNLISSQARQKQIKAELEYAADTYKEAGQKPYLKDLPIIGADYSIYYNSIKNEIDVVFAKDIRSENELENTYKLEIINKLQKIKIDTSKVSITWHKAH